MRAPAHDERLSTASAIKSGIVAGLVERATELGVDSTSWFDGMRVSRGEFAHRGSSPYLSYREACRIIQRALPTLPGHDHGLVLGNRQSMAEFGLIGLAMISSATFGDALRIGVHFAPITGALLELAIDEHDPDGLAVTMRMPTREPGIEAYLCEELIASCLNLCRDMLGPNFHGSRVDLSYPPPPHAARYQEVLGAPVRFGCADSRVTIARHWLDVPMPAANPDAAHQVLALCRAQMPSEQPPAGVVELIQHRLALQLGETPRLTDLAAELQMTERTLRRQLRAAGTSFRLLHDQVREQAATTLLRDGHLSVGQVAAAVGFGEVRDFRRAFKRWTGRLPSDLRRSAARPARDRA